MQILCWAYARSWNHGHIVFWLLINQIKNACYKTKRKCQKLQEGFIASTTSCYTLQYSLHTTWEASPFRPATSCTTLSFPNTELQMNKETALTGLRKVTTKLHHHNGIPQKGPNKKEARSQGKTSYFHCYMCLTNMRNILLVVIFKKRNLSLALTYTFQEVIWKSSDCKLIHYRLRTLMFQPFLK